MLRTLYGLKSSPLAWFECFSETILGFAQEFQDVTVSQLVSDSCIFLIHKGDDKIYTTIYIDDVLTLIGGDPAGQDLPLSSLYQAA